MNGAQIAMAIMLAVSLGIDLAKHGETKTEKYNFWIGLIGLIIHIGILAWGGFWS
jgi:hypothetical protein